MEGLVQLTEYRSVAKALSGVVQRLKFVAGCIDHRETASLQTVLAAFTAGTFHGLEGASASAAGAAEPLGLAGADISRYGTDRGTEPRADGVARQDFPTASPRRGADASFPTAVFNRPGTLLAGLSHRPGTSVAGGITAIGFCPSAAAAGLFTALSCQTPARLGKGVALAAGAVVIGIVHRIDPFRFIPVKRVLSVCSLSLYEGGKGR